MSLRCESKKVHEVFLLFARLFREAPTAELLREIVRSRLFSREDPEWPNRVEALAVEYARLFVVPGEQAVRPYESVYCDTLTIDTSTACSPYFEPEPPLGGLTGFLHGPSTTSVRETYRRSEFELRPEVHELPDHLAIELEFMGRLCERGSLEETQGFFREHLGRWAFRCLEEIKQKTRSDFYRAIAETLTAFLQQEQAHLLEKS